MSDAKFEVYKFYPPYDEANWLDESNPADRIPISADDLEQAYAEARRLIDERRQALGDNVQTQIHFYHFVCWFTKDGQDLERWHLIDKRPKRAWGDFISQVALDAMVEPFADDPT